MLELTIAGDLSNDARHLGYSASDPDVFHDSHQTTDEACVIVTDPGQLFFVIEEPCKAFSKIRNKWGADLPSACPLLLQAT
jgi:hypothetical protein